MIYLLQSENKLLACPINYDVLLIVLLGFLTSLWGVLIDLSNNKDYLISGKGCLKMLFIQMVAYFSCIKLRDHGFKEKLLNIFSILVVWAVISHLILNLFGVVYSEIFFSTPNGREFALINTNVYLIDDGGVPATLRFSSIFEEPGILCAIIVCLSILDSNPPLYRRYSMIIGGLFTLSPLVVLVLIRCSKMSELMLISFFIIVLAGFFGAQLNNFEIYLDGVYRLIDLIFSTSYSYYLPDTRSDIAIKSFDLFIKNPMGWGFQSDYAVEISTTSPLYWLAATGWMGVGYLFIVFSILMLKINSSNALPIVAMICVLIVRFHLNFAIIFLAYCYLITKVYLKYDK